jgi:hypothetical protein
MSQWAHAAGAGAAADVKLVKKNTAEEMQSQSIKKSETYDRAISPEVLRAEADVAAMAVLPRHSVIASALLLRYRTYLRGSKYWTPPDDDLKLLCRIVLGHPAPPVDTTPQSGPTQYAFFVIGALGHHRDCEHIDGPAPDKGEITACLLRSLCDPRIGLLRDSAGLRELLVQTIHSEPGFAGALLDFPLRAILNTDDGPDASPLRTAVLRQFNWGFENAVKLATRVSDSACNSVLPLAVKRLSVYSGVKHVIKALFSRANVDGTGLALLGAVVSVDDTNTTVACAIHACVSKSISSMQSALPCFGHRRAHDELVALQTEHSVLCARLQAHRDAFVPTLRIAMNQCYEGDRLPPELLELIKAYAHLSTNPAEVRAFYAGCTIP